MCNLPSFLPSFTITHMQKLGMSLPLVYMLSSGPQGTDDESTRFTRQGCKVLVCRSSSCQSRPSSTIR